MRDGPAQDAAAGLPREPPRRTSFSIGHRGAGLVFPEHTLEAYEAAFRMGAGTLECDVTFTKDLGARLPALAERSLEAWYVSESGFSSRGGLRERGFRKTGAAQPSLISVIIVVYNGARYLEQALQSVINQTYGNVELLVVDGGSTDGSLEILRRYEGQIDCWISEKDAGISDVWPRRRPAARRSLPPSPGPSRGCSLR